MSDVTGMWGRPGLGLDNHERARIAIGVSAALAGIDVDLAVLAGSLNEGIGHANSDVDVVVVAADPSAVPTTFELEGWAGTFEPFPRAEFEALAGRFSSYTVGPRNREQAALREPAWKQITRLANGTLLIASDRGRLALEAVDIHVVRQVAIFRALVAVSRWLEDATGGLRSNDAFTAVGATDLALWGTVELACVAAGDWYVGPQTTWLRAARLTGAGRGTAERLWQLARGRPEWGAPADEVASYVRSVAWAATVVAAQAADRGWEEPLGDLEVPPLPVPDGRLMPAPGTVVLRFAGDEASFVSRGRSFATSHNALRIWSRLCNGRGIGAAADAVPALRKAGLVIAAGEQPGWL